MEGESSTSPFVQDRDFRWRGRVVGREIDLEMKDEGSVEAFVEEEDAGPGERGGGGGEEVKAWGWGEEGGVLLN